MGKYSKSKSRSSSSTSKKNKNKLISKKHCNDNKNVKKIIRQEEQRPSNFVTKKVRSEFLYTYSTVQQTLSATALPIVQFDHNGATSPGIVHDLGLINCNDIDNDSQDSLSPSNLGVIKLLTGGVYEAKYYINAAGTFALFLDNGDGPKIVNGSKYASGADPGTPFYGHVKFCAAPGSE